MGAVVRVSELSDVNRLEQRPPSSALAQCMTLECSPSHNAAYAFWSQKLLRVRASLSTPAPSFLAPGQHRSVSRSLCSGRVGRRQQPGWGSAAMASPGPGVSRGLPQLLGPHTAGRRRWPLGLPVIRKAQPHLWTKHLIKS